MSGEPIISLVPGPPKLVGPDDQTPRDPGAWGYYTEVGPYHRAMWRYRATFALAILLDFAPLIYLILESRRTKAAKTRKRWWLTKTQRASALQ